jgi:hypothetical protein
MHDEDAIMADTDDTKFYVYEHWRSDINVPFYVGKGHGSRSSDMLNGRNSTHVAMRSQLAALGVSIQIRIVANRLSEEAAFAMERERIAYWRDAGFGLVNLSCGGEGCSGYKHTPEAIAKTVAFHTGRKRSAETRARIAARAAGRKVNTAVIEMLASINRGKKRYFTEEHKANIGAASKGRPMPPHVKEALRLSHVGKPRIQTAETRAKLSAAKKGKKLGPMSAAHRAAISAGNKGKRKSPEGRANIAMAARRRHAKKAE